LKKKNQRKERRKKIFFMLEYTVLEEMDRAEKEKYLDNT
jgi:hypothetical protein